MAVSICIDPVKDHSDTLPEPNRERILRHLIASLWIALCVLFLLPPAEASDTVGPVILTVAGNIEETNRGPLDEFEDAYFNTQEVEFDKAYVFDLASLEDLGTRKIRTGYPDWPKSFEFEGPLLSDVLKAVGSRGTVISVRAIDGYASEIEVTELEKYPVILALKKDGKHLGIGSRGPLWVVFPRDDYPELAEQDDAKFVWAVYYIDVR